MDLPTRVSLHRPVPDSMNTASLSALQDIVGESNVLWRKADTWPYGYDNSRRHAQPDAVVFPSSHQHICDIVRLCNQHRINLIARGRGTGTTGATVPTQGGVVLSLEKMNRIINIDPDNRIMTVEPGVINQSVQEAAAQHGFFWPPDPGSAAFCTIGGNLSYNSAGPHAVKYGTPRENVLGLTAVTGQGESLRTGVYTTKGVVGYDLTRLIIGSEGTLAIITEATLKLTPLPEAKRTLRAVYKDVASAARAVTAIMAQPVIPCALEFMDRRAIEMIREYSSADLPRDAGAMLMIEVDGATAGLDEAAATVRKAATVEGTVDIAAATTPQEVRQLWQTRKALSPALRSIAPKKINEDVVVPVSRLPRLIAGLEELEKKYQIVIVNFGHAGNGNIHVNLLVDPDEGDQLERAQRCLDEVFSLVLQLNGTLSGEHGVGLEKRDYVSREIEPATLDLMKRIKNQFDPNGILNPGKLFP